jgi:hypothetical protein
MLTPRLKIAAWESDERRDARTTLFLTGLRSETGV